MVFQSEDEELPPLPSLPPPSLVQRDDKSLNVEEVRIKCIIDVINKCMVTADSQV